MEINPVARPLPTQDNTNTEEMRTDRHASNGIPTHDPRIWAGEDIENMSITKKKKSLSSQDIV
jgi:hypothetical protein